MISVTVKNDSRLHLAPKAPGRGVSSFTLCLEKWADRTQCHVGDEFCPICLEKYKSKYQKEHTNEQS